MNHHAGWPAVFGRIGFRDAPGEHWQAWARIPGFFGRHRS